MYAVLLMIGTWIERLIWGIICSGLLLGLVLWIGGAMHHVISWLWRLFSPGRLTHSRIATFLLAGALAGAMLPIPTEAAAQGWSWGSPINPGFDRSTVIRVGGTVTRVNSERRSGPSTLTLECPRDTYTVILGPAWYLEQIGADIREGDPLTVEGSKMMDRGGKLHILAARVTNERTGAVLDLRDDSGRPRWMGGGPSGRIGR